MEDEMLKNFAVAVALMALATGPLFAREREATLQRITGPDGTFDMVVAAPKSANAPVFDLGETFDAFVIHLTGGALWVGFENAVKMLEAVEMLRRPLGAFYVGDRTNPVTVYIVPRSGALALGR